MTELNVASAQERFNLTPYEVLIVASLIEEETKVDAERAQVARVIYNRLQPGHPARDRRHLALRGRAGRSRPRGHRLRERLALQHAPHRRTPAHADRVARPRQHRGRSQPRRRAVDLLRARGRGGEPLLHRQQQRVPRRQGAVPRRRPGLRVARDHRAHPRGRRDRHADPALAVARHLQRRVRRRRARLGLPRLRRARGRRRARPRRRCGRSASTACRSRCPTRRRCSTASTSSRPTPRPSAR